MNTRDDSLDAARGVLMMLGVFLHASNIYAPGGGWVIADTHTHPAFAWIGSVIHAFRMPAFFWISGYFSVMVLARPNPGQQLRVRLQRIVLPMVAVWLTINALQMQLTARAGFDPNIAYPPPIYHLWFLVDLVVYTLLLCLLGRPLQWLARGTPSTRPRLALLGWLVVFVFGAWVVNAAVRASGIAYVNVFGLTSAYRLASYLPYFLLGAVMFGRRDLASRFVALSPWLFPLGVAGALAVNPLTHTGTSAAVREAALLGELAATVLCVGSLLGLFRRVFNAPSRLGTLMSDSAYTVYLLHHVVVVAVGLALIELALPLALKYILVMGMAFVLPLAVHLWGVRRFSAVSWVLNGRPLRA